MKNLLKALLTTVLASGVALLFVAGITHAESLPISGQTYYLAGAGVTSTMTAIQLTSFTTPDGSPITMSEIGTEGYGALGVGTSQIEDISFTGITQNTNGTATLTGVTRGVEFYYPYASNVNLELSHSGGSTFIITNTAEFYYNEFIMTNNLNTPYSQASSSPASVGYVNNAAFNGAAVVAANTTTSGVVRIATSAQTASTSPTIGGYQPVIPSSIATDTPDASCNSATTTPGAGCVPVANLYGLINNTFLPNIGKNYVVLNSTGTSTWAVPSGLTNIAVTTIGTGAPGGSCSPPGSAYQGAGGGSGAGTAFGIFNVSATTSIQYFIAATSTATTTQAGWATFGTNGYFEKAFGGEPGSSLQGSSGSSVGLPVVGGTASGGIVNIQGQPGQGGLQDVVTYAMGGMGGGTAYGYGGPNAGLAQNSGNSIGGNNATGYGASGSGAACTASSAQTGGSGTDGEIIINY